MRFGREIGWGKTRREMPLLYHGRDAAHSQDHDAHNDIWEHRASSLMAGEDRGRRSSREEKTSKTVIT